MKTAIVQMPGLNRDRDMIKAVRHISGKHPVLVWETDSDLPHVDLVIIPGGFSYGDYLRCGAIAARMPILRAIVNQAAKGLKVLGVCNGFQILVEAGLLPGALMRNKSLKFVSKLTKLEVVNNKTIFSSCYEKNQIIACPIAHHDGNYFTDADTLKALQDKEQIVFRYAQGHNPNGSLDDIAGIINDKGNILGMMPHPEDYVEPMQGGTDGKGIFKSILNSLM